MQGGKFYLRNIGHERLPLCFPALKNFTLPYMEWVEVTREIYNFIKNPNVEKKVIGEEEAEGEIKIGDYMTRE